MEVLTVAPDGLTQEDLVALTGAGPGSLKSLTEKRFLTTELRTITFEIKDDGVVEELPGPELFTQEQRSASEIISNAITNPNQSKPILIFGCTGSGKTLLYIKAIRQVLKQGRTALILVPEISLTPQTVRRFRAVFGNQVAVQHSAMPPRERATLWQQILQGQFPVVVGARSAVFAPLPRLGLIVVDEEHSPTFKQFDPAPRYHARDAALMRAKMEEAAIILGSATPSLESFHNASQNRYQRIDLTSRADGIPMPEVHIIDRTQKSDAKPIGSAFTSELIVGIKDKIGKKEQVILLQNRRGFSTFIRCLDCGYVPMCKRCDITMTYHKLGHHIRCHYCGSKSKAPTECSVCHSTRLDYAGTGTQRVEEELEASIPGLKMVRMDLDTTSERGSHQRILSAFQRGGYDVLLGTQMVAKGLDLPKVTLVGVISADTELFLPDFRASERTFALLSQAAGRAGRREKPGVVLIQTYHPNNPVLEPVMHHDYQEFFRNEIASRKDLGYPPFSRLVLIRFSGKQEPQVVKAAERFRELMEERIGKLEILGPSAAAVTRVKDRYQYQILVKSTKQHDPSGEQLRHAVSFTKRAYAAIPGLGKVSAVVDVDPIGFL
jgi:primosomal protein N' (replication factor Y)